MTINVKSNRSKSASGSKDMTGENPGTSWINVSPNDNFINEAWSTSELMNSCWSYPVLTSIIRTDSSTRWQTWNPPWRSGFSRLFSRTVPCANRKDWTPGDLRVSNHNPLCRYRRCRDSVPRCSFGWHHQWRLEADKPCPIKTRLMYWVYKWSPYKNSTMMGE